MSAQPTVEQLLALIQQEREKTKVMENEKTRLRNVLTDEKKKQEHLQQACSKVSIQKDQAQKELDKVKSNKLSLSEKESAYVDQIEIALADVQYGDMSLGDLNRLASIYLNELTRVNSMISKLTNNNINL
ncbi:predicted protein [Naegleria gruberi]|uniref:Predicted protein n=1 Tax=Naegleria gruberi TaxID=5762 RepID=D2VN82_NAEGR|nr:uncharacterized protein NAEGRDRAFT_70403 [Naegleria gruberi]EFC41698.1 predicted protein [Naegleria gruberi]|eukprot:XP_002674442.1 predicted protein [Naegleria gruberi strain NEG-M]